MANKKGLALIFSFIIIVILTILGVAALSRSISENRFAQRSAESAQAFWLAEAGINDALDELKDDFHGLSGITNTQLGPGGYNVVMSTNQDGSRIATAYGFVPYASPRHVERAIAVKVKPGFYDNAIYTAGNYETSGSPTVTGNVYVAETLPLLDFNQLRLISQAQGNYHTAEQLGGPFPVSFWYSEGIPNVVFMEGNLDLRGAQDQVGGFYIVGGEVIYDATLSGTACIDGTIYTRGDFTVNGGGSVPFSVSGGVWVGGDAELNGTSVTIGYEPDYMSAIRSLDVVPEAEAESGVVAGTWQEVDPIYNLVP